jgi:hypothetical protein
MLLPNKRVAKNKKSAKKKIAKKEQAPYLL